MKRWSWSKLSSQKHGGGHTGEVIRRPGLLPDVLLDLDELIAMRGRRPVLGRNKRADGFRFGDLSSRRRGIGLDLDNIGPYQWGDDIRHMDWFATARTGRPQVKQFRHDVQQTIIIALDLRSHMVFGTRQYPMMKTACLAAAKVAWSTSYNHQPLGLMILAAGRPVLIPPRRGRRTRLQHLARIVEGYAQAIDYEGDTAFSLAKGLDHLATSMAGDVEAVVISDFSDLGQGFDQTLREVSARGSTSAIVVEDILMQEPPPHGFYPLRRGADPALSVVAIRADNENVYRGLASDHRRALTTRLAGLGMRQVLFSDPQSINEGYFR